MASTTWKNWLGNHSCRPAALLLPTSEQEIADAVGQASAEGHKVKIAGAGHSWTDIACTDDWMMSLDRYAELLHVDRDNNTVTVQAGIRLDELCKKLRDLGLALGVLGTVRVQSIAGAISTGTHGTGIRFGSLCSLVTSLNLVTASGKVLRCSRQENPDVFAAAGCGLGALGVISSVTLQCEDENARQVRGGPEEIVSDVGCVPDRSRPA